MKTLAKTTVVAFRVDASFAIGTGHVMRCLTLADALRQRGAHCIFVCRAHPGHLFDLIRQRGYLVLALPIADASSVAPLGASYVEWLGVEPAIDAEQTRQALGEERPAWLVVDHYALSRTWELAVYPACSKLMVIDDLANRSHECDLLLDQNLGREEGDYKNFVPTRTRSLIGPKFSLLRPEFEQRRKYSLARRANPTLKHLLITMGGVDEQNITTRVLEELSMSNVPNDLRITVVMGPRAPWLKQVYHQAENMPWPTQVQVGVHNMAQLMADTDMAIGAAGGTAWERCALGLPTVLLVLAENQRQGAQALYEAGAAVMLQEVGEIPAALKPFTCAFDKMDALRQLSQSAANLVDGGGTARVLQEMLCNHV